MTDPLDELLSKARLAPTAPYTSSDVDAAHQRLAARIAARAASPAPRRETVTRQRSDQELHTLCTVVVSEPSAVEDLVAFVSDCMPGTAGGRILGSILYLRDRPESARFWWQYAAGDGDRAALYCLYLHHRAIGETGEAAWWHEQFQARCLPGTERSRLPALRSPMQRLDGHSRQLFERMRAVDNRPVPIFQALRILRSLRVKWSLPDGLDTVMDYVAVAVGWADPDLDLPLPDWDFVTRVKTLTAHGTTPSARHRTARRILQTRSTRERATREHAAEASDLPASRGPNLAPC